ncbi:MAG: HAMP domain-containing protein [Candidatus Rokubacteria bacterium]|nr:HAMP domain-containing protein [Candidatus Rokubacteria bacterium]
MRFRSFQGRIVVFVVGLLMLMQVLTFVVVDLANTRDARGQIRDQLLVGGRVFNRLIKARDQQLAEAARLLSGDFAFKAAYSTFHAGTVLSALENHQARIGADVMVLVSPDAMLLADTLHPEVPEGPFAFPELIHGAEDSGEASAIVFLDGRPYQMVIVPLLAPVPVAWIGMGFTIDDKLARDLQRLTRLHVSFVSGEPGVETFASTLPPSRRQALLRGLPGRLGEAETFSVYFDGEEHISHAVTLSRETGPGIAAVLQKSVEEAFEPLYRLRRNLLALLAAGLIVSVIGGVAVARTVSRPVQTLVRGVREIEQGDYGHRVTLTQQDELGELATAINHMVVGIAEREERIRWEAANSAQLEIAKLKAEEASQAKSRFLATMSHELRTPLNAIIGFSQVLIKGIYGGLNEKQVDFVTKILTSGRHLLHLINEILDLSKIEAGRMQLERSRFDATEALRDVVTVVETLARQKSILLNTEIEPDLPPLTADAPKFKQIMLNLLSNAIKFTHEGGRVHVSAGVESRAEGDGGPRQLLRVSVTDTGIGIKPEDQERIFGSFEQVDSSYAREQQGTGLGLALTRKLVELHGGRIWVESEGVALKGATFTFAIPFEARLEEAVASS